MEKSISEKSLALPAPQERMKALQHKKGTLRRLFRNFDQSNNSYVSQHEFLNITNKLGAKLTQRVRLNDCRILKPSKKKSPEENYVSMTPLDRSITANSWTDSKLQKNDHFL